MTTILNYTPHTITIQNAEGETTSFVSSGVARVAAVETPADTVEDFPVVEQTFGEILGLPEPAEETVYVVSAIVLAAAKQKGLKCCISPNTGPTAIRNENGQITAVRGFVK